MAQGCRLAWTGYRNVSKSLDTYHMLRSQTSSPEVEPPKHSQRRDSLNATRTPSVEPAMKLEMTGPIKISDAKQFVGGKSIKRCLGRHSSFLKARLIPYVDQYVGA